MVFFCVCVCVGSRTKSAWAVFLYLFILLFIYLFVYKSEVLVTWFLVWMCRREKPWSQYTVSRLSVSWAAISFFSVGVLLILKFLRVVLSVHMVSWSRFPFWRFRWVHLSLNFLYKLTFWLQNIAVDRRKPIKFAFLFLPVLFVIWGLSSVIPSGVYNRRSFCHRSCLALFTSQQSSPWTFRFGDVKLYKLNV